MLGRYAHTPFDLRDTEVSAEVRKIEGTDGPGNLEEINLGRPCDQDCDVADCVILPMDPEVRYTWKAVLVMLVYELHPSSRLVFIFHYSEGVQVIGPRRRKAKAVDGDPAYACDDPKQIIVSGIEFGGQDQHRVIQSELGFRRCALTEGTDGLGNLVVISSLSRDT